MLHAFKTFIAGTLGRVARGEAGGKEPMMTQHPNRDTNATALPAATANPPAASGGNDLALQVAELAKVMQGLAQSQTAVLQSLARLAPNSTAESRPLTIGDVNQAIASALTQQQATAAQSAARDQFIAQKMTDLPAIYRRQMPQTADPAALAQAEQVIRAQYQADFRTAGGKVPNLGGDAPGGVAPLQTIDISKLSGYDLIGIGIQRGQAAPAPRAE